MRGFWYMVEAILAGIIILGFLIAISGRYIATSGAEDIALKGYEILKGLDDQGLLRNYTIAEDFSGLDSRIQFFSYNHTIQICREDGSCVGSTPTAADRYVATYLVAGNGTLFKPYEVRLYLF